MFPRGAPGPIICGGQSISQSPRPAAMPPSALTANHARYSPVCILRASHGRKESHILSRASSSRYPISLNIARRCLTMVSASLAAPLRMRRPGTTRSVFRLASVFTFDSVVAFAGLHLPILVGGLDLDFAEGAVFRRIDRRVADGILAAHFVLELIEGLL